MSIKKDNSRIRRKSRIRKKISGSTERPRLTIFKSIKHIYGQIVDDSVGATLVSVSSSLKSFSASGGNVEGAKLVGASLGEEALKKGIQKVVFDRNGYRYHGRVKALADAAREKGLQF